LAVVLSETPNRIRLVDAKTGDEIRRIELHARLVRMEFSPDGKRIAATERDNAVRMYDCESGKEAWSQIVQLTNPFENYTSAIAISPDGKIVAAGATDKCIYLFDSKDGEAIGRLVGHTEYPWALAFTVDSKMLYSSGWDGAIRRWDVAARKQLPLPQGVHVGSAIAASPNGRRIAYEDDSGMVYLANSETGAVEQTFQQPGIKFSQLAFSPNSRQLTAGGSGGDQVDVTIWNVADGNMAHHWHWPKGKDPHSTIECLAFSPDGKALAAAVFRQSRAYLWDLQSDEQIGELTHDDVYGLAFSADSKTLATAGWDNCVRFWNASTATERNKLVVKTVLGNAPGDLRMYTVCCPAQGNLFATAHLDGMVRIWQADNLKLRNQFQTRGRFVFGAMTFSPDGLWLATGGADGSVSIWNPSTGQCVCAVGRHESYVFTIGFGHDTRTIVSGGEDGGCYLWSLRPSGQLPNKSPKELWHDLAGDDGAAAYEAMWKLAETPDATVKLLAEKLRPIKSVADLNDVPADLSLDEIQRRSNLAKISIGKHPDVLSREAAARAIALLGELNSPVAAELLNEVASHSPSQQMRDLAQAALARRKLDEP
jgi:WD40 repeat protein